MLAAPDLAITFSGGGNRSFYQLGLFNRWRDLLLPRLRIVTGCSAGACVATATLSGRSAEALAYWKRRRAGVDRNLDFRRLFAASGPAPHGPIYRDTLLHAFSEGGLDNVRRQPFPILVLTTAVPRRLPILVTLALGLAAHRLESYARPTALHPTWARRLGFSPWVFDARDCETKEELAALVLASSATPPFTPLGRLERLTGDRRFLDGGLIDSAPAFLADHTEGVRHHVVLLAQPMADAAAKRQGGRLYLSPTAPPPISRWDYTRPALFDATIALGEADADIHLPHLQSFFSRRPASPADPDRSSAPPHRPPFETAVVGGRLPASLGARRPSPTPTASAARAAFASPKPPKNALRSLT